MTKFIIAKRCGRLANRIILYANVIAWAEEYSITVINFTFQSYAHLFQSTLNSSRCSYPSKKKNGFHYLFKPFIYFLNLVRLPHQLTSLFCKILLKFNFIQKFYPIISDTNLIKPSSLSVFQPMKMFESHSTVFIYGWKFREPKLTHKHAQKIRDFFKPTNEINRVIEEKVSRIRNDYDLLIGVHIRRGDYDKWKGGKYLYSQRDYLKFMLKISELYPSSNIVFLICSNENVDSCIFESLSIEVMDASPIEDLYTLSECDLLIGPPSTFTQWASFYGEKPLLHIYSLSDSLTTQDFRVRDITETPS